MFGSAGRHWQNWSFHCKPGKQIFMMFLHLHVHDEESNLWVGKQGIFWLVQAQTQALFGAFPGGQVIVDGHSHKQRSFFFFGIGQTSQKFGHMHPAVSGIATFGGWHWDSAPEIIMEERMRVSLNDIPITKTI